MKNLYSWILIIMVSSERPHTWMFISTSSVTASAKPSSLNSWIGWLHFNYTKKLLFCVGEFVTHHFQSRWIAEIRKGEPSESVSLCQYIVFPQQVIYCFLSMVTDGNWAPSSPRQNYKGGGKMRLARLGRQPGQENEKSYFNTRLVVKR